MTLATRNVICGANNPSSDAATMRIQSLRAIRSRGMKADSSQNSTVAPAARIVKSIVGVMASELAISLHITMFSPKMM